MVVVFATPSLIWERACRFRVLFFCVSVSVHYPTVMFVHAAWDGMWITPKHPIIVYGVFNYTKVEGHQLFWRNRPFLTIWVVKLILRSRSHVTHFIPRTFHNIIAQPIHFTIAFFTLSALHTLFFFVINYVFICLLPVRRFCLVTVELDIYSVEDRGLRVVGARSVQQAPDLLRHAWLPTPGDGRGKGVSLPPSTLWVWFLGSYASGSYARFVFR